ncbi:PREDICTED: disrupted in renal carcinoma protein 2 homolog [Polistes dominula]|uniref:Disrupted in renal carcinoma protein 2 homolog n=1 Tax=Polistes dominula TaxID=743375 RepID=A0ABM1J501_POLDO|nr:PREDICTED: disrupted in renal carcinoma protein 2 homolog [Polistes dominula]
MNRLQETQSSPCKDTMKDCSKSKLTKIYPKSTGNLKVPQSSHFRKDQAQSFDHEYVEKDLNEVSNLINQNSKVPKERWIALALFCILSSSQCCIWNTWGPITIPTMIAFSNWQKYHIALLSDWGCITYLTFCLPCCWFLYKKGLVAPIRMAAILSALAAFIRCFSCNETIFTITAHLAAILNGLSGVIIGPATALVSAVWFPRGERTTATGISSASNQFGMAVSYLIGPAVVGDIFHPKSSSNNNRIQTILRVQIMSLMRIEFVIQSLIVVGIIAFFPNHPNAIDATDTSSHLSLIDSLLFLLKKKNMWQLCLAAALSQGVTGPWLSMITLTFDSMVTQEEADKLAFWTIIFGSVISLVASRVADIFQNHLRIGLFVLLMISVTMFLWVLLLENQILIFRKEELYAAVIFGVSASWSTPALFLELASEIAFPVSEAIVGGYMIFLANLIGTLFYFSYFIPGIGDRWSTYCVFVNLAISTILIFYLKEEYNRT